MISVSTTLRDELSEVELDPTVKLHGFRIVMTVISRNCEMVKMVVHRCLSFTRRAFSVSSDSSIQLAEFLTKKAKIDSKLHHGVLKALKQVYGDDMTVSQLEAFGHSGLQSLAESVERELPRVGKERRTVRFKVPHHNTEFDLPWRSGESLLDVSKTPEGDSLLGEYMEGTCGGQMSCCTCHIYLEPSVCNKLRPPTEAEEDMLDLAFEPVENQSRLGCQIKLDDNMLQILESKDKLVVTIPGGVTNVWN